MPYRPLPILNDQQSPPANLRQQPSTSYTQPQHRSTNGYIPSTSGLYGGEPMQQTFSDSSTGSHGSYGYQSSISSDEYYASQTISPSATQLSPTYTNPNTSTLCPKPEPTPHHQPHHHSTSSSSSPTGELHCLFPQCEYKTKRQYDLNRHQKMHNSSAEKFGCWGRNCHRVGENGFDRKDHLTEHLRKVHMKEIPKKGSRGGKSSGTTSSSSSSGRR